MGPPTGTDRFIRSYSTTAGSPCSPAVRQVCPPTGAFRMVKSSVVSFLKLYFGQPLYHCQILCSYVLMSKTYNLMSLHQNLMLLCSSVKYKKEQPLRIALLFCCPIRTRTLNYRTKTWRVANYTMGQTSSAFFRKTVQIYKVILIWARETAGIFTPEA